jgi:hypothetical protein
MKSPSVATAPKPDAASRVLPPGILAWRPQRFGKTNAKKIVEPLIEPLWDGLRVLVRIGLGGAPVEVVDDEGTDLDDIPDIVEALGAAARASSLVLDGYLTRQATRNVEGTILRTPDAPSAGDMTAQLFLGSAGQRRRQELARAKTAATMGGPIAFVAVDLLLLDDQSILTVPLLERKRLLEGVLEETELVRRTLFIRPPVDSWVGTWRSLGFGAMAYKAANSRYHPGEPEPGWATAQIPAR